MASPCQLITDYRAIKIGSVVWAGSELEISGTESS